MGDKGNQKKPNGSRPQIYQLPGTPHIVINGVPDIPITSCDSTIPAPIAETNKTPPIDGEWFEGREVRKWFNGIFYSGLVADFDKKNGWFRVLYEDGDSEDLEWDELEEILLPLDVTIPLKTLAENVLRRRSAKAAALEAEKNERRNSTASASTSAAADVVTKKKTRHARKN